MRRLTFTGRFNQAAILDALLDTGLTPEQVHVAGLPDGTEIYIDVDDAVADAQVQAVIDAHDPDAPSRAEVRSQAVETFYALKRDFADPTGSKDVIAGLMHGLDSLTVEDKSYVLLARIMALKDGLTMAQVQTATTKAQAVAYITGKSEWTGLPTNTRPMMVDVLETMAGMIHVLILVLS